MTAGKLALTCEKGATFYRLITWRGPDGEPIDLTGCTAQFLVTKQRGSGRQTVVSLTTGDGITVGGIDGTLTILMPATQTITLLAGGYYELTVGFVGGRVERLIEGEFTLSPVITS